LCCPSDNNAGDVESAPTTCVTFQNTTTCSYAASYGDTSTVISAWEGRAAGKALDNPFRRSPFGYRFYRTNALAYTGTPPLNDEEKEDKTFSNITDGTSNTLCFGERCVSTSASQMTAQPASGGNMEGATGTWKGTIAVVTLPQESPSIRKDVGNVLALKSLEKTMGTNTAAKFKVGAQDSYPGGFLGRFVHVSAPAVSMFTAVLPPNSPNATENGYGYRAVEFFNRAAIISASSYHRGGANVSLADGGVHFVTETIDCQTPELYPPTVNLHDYEGQSMFGVWGALGSVNGSEAAAMP
jgi:prepilin-type processing-associated H-X9-DG protein